MNFGGFYFGGPIEALRQAGFRVVVPDQIGFGRDQAGKSVDPEAIAVDFSAEQVENVANFQAYGFLPELVARFTRVVPFKALDATTLKDILRTDVVTRMTREFKLEGFELTVEEAVLDHIVDDALNRETGARGLASTLTRSLEDAAFDAFGVADGGAVRVVIRDDTLAVELHE